MIVMMKYDNSNIESCYSNYDNNGSQYGKKGIVKNNRNSKKSKSIPKLQHTRTTKKGNQKKDNEKIWFLLLSTTTNYQDEMLFGDFNFPNSIQFLNYNNLFQQTTHSNPKFNLYHSYELLLPKQTTI